MIIRLEHCRAITGPNGKGYCSRGMREFAKQQGLDWEDFLANGIDSAILGRIDDEMVRRVIEGAERNGK